MEPALEGIVGLLLFLSCFLLIIFYREVVGYLRSLRRPVARADGSKPRLPSNVTPADAFQFAMCETMMPELNDFTRRVANEVPYRGYDYYVYPTARTLSHDILDNGVEVSPCSIWAVYVHKPNHCNFQRLQSPLQIGPQLFGCDNMPRYVIVTHAEEPKRPQWRYRLYIEIYNLDEFDFGAYNIERLKKAAEEVLND